MSFFEELKRRNVFRVGTAYVVVAWLIMQVADVVLNNIDMPAWVFHLILLLLAIGFPLTLLFAWAYELTPDGIRKEADIAASASVARQTGHKLNYVIIGALVMAVVYLVVFRDRVDDDSQTPIQTILARPSVVVLPFTNTSGDDSQDYLSFGITNELITGLQRYKSFPVVSHNATLEYKGAGLSTDEFAKSVGASYQVEGSITTVNKGIRVLATLSHVGGNQVWADRFERDAGKDELFDLADELVSKVAAAVLESEIQRVNRIDQPPSDAWEHYIKGLEIVMNFDPDDYESARRHLDQAIDIAPDMAEAWWAIGELEIANYVSKPLPDNSGLDELYPIIEYFRKSNQLNPVFAAACGCLGYLAAVVGQPDEARAVFSQAIETNPLAVDLRLTYAYFLLGDGRYEEAVENTDIAWKLASGWERAGVWLNRSIVALARGNKTEALDAVNRAIFIDKSIYRMPQAVALLYVLGEQAAAARLLAEMELSFPGISLQNPYLVFALKPINDILANQRDRGERNGPADVNEIYSLLRNID